MDVDKGPIAEVSEGGTYAPSRVSRVVFSFMYHPSKFLPVQLFDSSLHQIETEKQGIFLSRRFEIQIHKTPITRTDLLIFESSS
jgi:hypothetical protein